MCHFAQDFVFSSSLSPSPILLSKGAAFHRCWLFWSRMYIYFILWFLTNTNYLFCWIQYLSKTSIIHQNPPAMFKHIGTANIHENQGKQGSRSIWHIVSVLSPKANNSRFKISAVIPTEGGGSSLYPCPSILIFRDALGPCNLCSLESRAHSNHWTETFLIKGYFCKPEESQGNGIIKPIQQAICIPSLEDIYSWKPFKFHFL